MTEEKTFTEWLKKHESKPNTFVKVKPSKGKIEICTGEAFTKAAKGEGSKIGKD